MSILDQNVKICAPLCLRLSGIEFSWASASRSMPPASEFWHPVSQSSTGEFLYWTGSPYSGARLVPASTFLFIPVPDGLDAGQSDIQKKWYNLHWRCTAGDRKGHTLHTCTSMAVERHTRSPCTLRVYTWIPPARPYCRQRKGRDTPCTAILLAVERDMPCTSIYWCWWW